MATGNIVRVWQAAGQVHAAVSVVEGGTEGSVEYIASVPDDAAWTAMSNAQKKAALTAAVKARRDEQRAARADVTGITGSVTL